eukprot:TCALIF_00285-PA protein Name:"Similar to FR FMRFamide receptor (Drosophila melanogaster)" AED:0.21 eAED:0.21 QI:91/0.57/0.37/0.62/0.57/0.75/8/0/476
MNFTTGSPVFAKTSIDLESPYFVTPHPDEALAACTNMVLRQDLKTLLNWQWWINGVFTSVVLTFGFTGNFVSIFVLLQPKMRNSFNQLLIALCICDTFFIFCNILKVGSAFGHKVPKYLSILDKLLDVLAQVSMCSSVLMIVAFTFERHFAICSPHQYRIHICTTPPWKHLSYYVVPVTLLSFFFNIPMFMNLDPSWMLNPTYVKINLWLRVLHPLTTTGVAPIAILIFLNIRICKGIILLHQRRTNRNIKEIRMTYIAIAIVTLFIIFNLPRIVAGAHEVFHTQLIIRCIQNNIQYIPDLMFFQSDTVARFFMILNSSVNFLVYCAGSKAFQEVFCERILKCRPKMVESNGVPRDDEDDEDADEHEERPASAKEENRRVIVRLKDSSSSSTRSNELNKTFNGDLTVVQIEEMPMENKSCQSHLDEDPVASSMNARENGTCSIQSQEEDKHELSAQTYIKNDLTNIFGMKVGVAET